MTINSHGVTPQRLGRLAKFIILLASVGLSSSPACAGTKGETLLAQSPMPHEHIGMGRGSVKVHWVRLQGYFEGANGHVAMMDDLKAQVRSCVQAAQLAGRQARPPRTRPEYVSISQHDAYDAENRSVSYDTTLLYTVSPSDCSLFENRKTIATLNSSKGICAIDLDDKSAHGFCDAHAHADATPLNRTGALAPNGRIVPPHGLNHASLDALQQAMKLAPGQTGEQRLIVGIECEVWKSALDPNGTACLSRGGSFVAAHAALGLTGSSMELEITSTIGVNLRATKAKLNAHVNPAVFAPYLADGFQVKHVGRNK